MNLVRSSVPRIGFDQFVSLEWATAAFKVRAGLDTPDRLNALLEAAGRGVVALKKTRTVLNRLWLEPRADLVEFADRGVGMFKADPSISIVALTWGMAISTYPFFGKVSEIMGRLSGLQGDCSSAQIHRRMSEIYGEREGTYRMTNMVLQSQASWGVIERSEKGKRFVRSESIVVDNEQAASWLIEAALRYVGKTVAVPSLSSLAVMYPFVLDQPLGYIASKSSHLEVMSQGFGDQCVGLSAAL